MNTAAGRPVVLIGPMAVGKSAIGQHLAQRLGVAFFDTDAMVSSAHGPIPEIFANRGERAFRELESRAVAKAIGHAGARAGRRPAVISLGGGAVLDSGTQQLLRGCTVVYLECDADTVAERLARGAGRPLLDGDAMGRWAALFTAREPVYRRLATIVFDVRAGNVPDLAHRLEEVLGEYDAANTADTTAPAATKEVEK